MPGMLENKLIIVTGCASGIGLATAKLYLEAGAVVFGLDIAPFPSPFPFAGNLKERFHFHQADLTASNACENAVVACLSQTGRKSIDVLANVAGIMDAFEAVHRTSDATWDRLFSVNATVPFRMMRAVINEGGMLAQRAGRIVNVASKAGISGAAAGFAYTASKHALVGMTRQAAWIYHNQGIRVNCVNPGGVPTNIKKSIQQDNFDQESFDRLAPFHRLNHNAEGGPSISAEDIAGAILWLSAGGSRNVSGLILPVDNAWSAC